MSAKWRRTRAYRIWRVTVIRNGKRCNICNSIHNRHAHHINHATYFPELRYEPSNGVVLCGDCHMILHNKFAGGYRKKCELKHLERFKYVTKYLVRNTSVDKAPTADHP